MSKRSPNLTILKASVLTLLLCPCLCLGNWQKQQANKAELPPKVSAELEQTVKLADDRAIQSADVETLFRSAIIKFGSVEPLLSWLADTRKTATNPRLRVLTEIESHVSARTGDLRRASRLIEGLLEDKALSTARVDLRLWQAGLFDSLGKVAEARDAYEKLVEEKKLSNTQQQEVRLRLALMGLLGDGKKDAKTLIELAEKSEDASFRNRAANVLAVQNKYKEAVKLFKIQGKETDRFRSASRVCEWAIRAKDREKALASGWEAVESAKIKRDRRYALALLVESYRIKEEKKGLEALVAEFVKRDKDENQTLTDEMRTVWISLLRELERYDDAIKLFKESAGGEGTFTVEMRRELLEMEGEAGRTDAMVESYRKLIEAEPNQLIWRGGLTRILLEQGKDKDARALWTEYIAGLEKGSLLLLAAQSLGELGLDDLATSTIERMVELKADAGEGLLYLADLQQTRGKLDQSEETLNRLNNLTQAGDVVRFELAAAFERVGRQDKSVEVIEGIRASRDEVATDLEMRLAWLYSETGEEEKALDQWLSLWKETKSVSRRRYVEDRLMTVASRLGTLGDIAVDLEVKLMDGKADDREAGLLTRIYSRVNDSVAASEVLEEYMTQAGKQEVERLQEKARIYQVCNDYWNYEKVIEQLIKTDPEGETDYLRQLALSMLERGKAKEAREVLMKLRGAAGSTDNIGGEFEAGVLSLVGMKKEAADAYRKGIATYPDRIESYLLLANLLKDLGQTDRAVGMFQYLAETADKDDLFTIAIDGLLNMEAPRGVLQWARRITLERLAARDDKNYLYQLLADLSEEVNDKSGQIRALENSLAVSGTRRQSILRECMDLSSRIRGGAFFSSSRRGPTNAGNKPFFAFGRRLIGLGELMPPQVFLDLGQAFLDDGDVGSAERTFNMARNHADERGYERSVAKIFEKAGRKQESLDRYDRLLRTNPSDVALIARVGTLNEQRGKDEIAAKFYQRGFDLLLAQTPLTTMEEEEETTGYWARNQDAYDKYAEQLVRGVLITMPDDSIDEFLAAEEVLLKNGLQLLEDKKAEGRSAKMLSDAPQIARRSEALRRLCFAFDRLEILQRMDLLLAQRFTEDDQLIGKLTKERLDRGEIAAARNFLQTSNADEATKNRFALALGNAPTSELDGTSKLAPKEMWQRLLPHWMSGDKAAALKVLRRIDTRKITGSALGQTINYVYTGGAPTYEQRWASDVFILSQLALTLGDKGLALQLARGRLQNSSSFSGPVFGDPGITLLKAFKGLLPPAEFNSLARFALSSYKDDDRNGLTYLWLVGQLKDESLSDEDLLAKLDDLKIGLDYYRFTFEQAAEIFPKSIFTDALTRVMDNTDQKMVAGPLAVVPFEHKKALDKDVQDVIVEGVGEGIPAAIKDNYLSYITMKLPGRYVNPNTTPPAIVQNRANADCAMRVLDQFNTEEIKASNPEVANRALGVKILLLNEIGKADEAIEMALKLYDPKRKITDYYERYTWERVQRELFPLAPEKFLAKTMTAGTTKKKSVEETDKRLAFLRTLNDEAAIRNEYEAAWAAHPKLTKYSRAYRSWEQRAGRTMNVLAIDQRLLDEARRKQETPKDAADAKRKAKSQQSRLTSMQRRLGDQWFAVGHPVNGLENWRTNDDLDIARFAIEKARREATAKAPPSKDEEKKVDPPEPKKPVTAQTAVPAISTTPAIRMTPARPAGGGVAVVKAARLVPAAVAATRTVAPLQSKTAAKPSTKPKTVKDLQKAFDAKKTDEAADILRDLWRSYPPIEATPYTSFSSPARVNSLRWPKTPKKSNPKKDKKEPTAEDKAKAEEAKKKAAEVKKKAEQDKRRRLRSGVAVLDIPPRVRPKVKPPETVWSKLASEPFAVAEMNRIVRSRTPAELDGLPEIVQALLKNRRAKEGDEAVFKSLLESIRSGRAGKMQTIQITSMLEDNHELLGDNAAEIIEDLSRNLNLDQASVSLQLAKLCVKSGQRERGAALFVHYASRASDRDYYNTDMNISFTKLIDDAREVFEGDELFELVERMFEATPVKSDVTLSAVLDLRHKQLSPQLAAERSDPFFAKLDSDPIATRVVPSVWGALIFAEANKLDRATQCLRSAILRTGMPVDEIGRVVYEQKLRRPEFLRLFPKEHDRFENYTAWLSAASAEINQQYKSGALPRAMAMEMLSICSYRQSQNGDKPGARKTLSPVLADIGKDKALRMLGIDALREAGLSDAALKLQRELYAAGTLSYVRYGDLLVDTAAVDGTEKAKALFEELVQVCLDKDLLDAAEGIASPERLSRIKTAATSAKKEHEDRLKAAAERRKTRSAWSKADAAERKKKADAEKAKKAKAAGDAKNPVTSKP